LLLAINDSMYKRMHLCRYTTFRPLAKYKIQNTA
jgi:hypothetical protein